MAVSHTISSKQMENTHVYISVYRLLLKALVVSSTNSLTLGLAKHSLITSAQKGKYGMALTTRQEILEYDRRFTIHSLRPLLEILGDLGELGHMVIEHLRVLARDGLEHSRSGENRHIGASCADYSSIR